MKNRVCKKPGSNSKGITLIEILLVLGLLAIVLSFAMPSVNGAVDRAEMKSTFENVQYSVQAARRTARMNETAISMNFSPSLQQATQTITFSSPDKKRASLPIQDFSLPSDIVLISDQESFFFDERGLVKNPGSIVLVSAVDESLKSTLEIR